MSDTARKMFPVETVLALAVAKKGADVKDIAGYITGRSIVCDACAAAVAPFAAAWLAKLSPKFLDMNYKDGDNWGDFVNQGARLLGDTISLTPMDDCLKNAVATVLDMMDDNEIIVYSIGGMPVEDVAWGTMVYRNALKKGIGTKLKLWDTPQMV